MSKDNRTTKPVMSRWFSSVLVYLALVVFVADMCFIAKFTQAGRSMPRYAGFGMAMAPLFFGLAVLAHTKFPFRLAAVVFGFGVSLGLALELVTFPCEFWGRGSQSPANWCIANLKQIEGAKANWALEEHKTTNDIPVVSDLYGADCYIAREPKCPLQGVYIIGRVGVPPHCSYAGHSLE